MKLNFKDWIKRYKFYLFIILIALIFFNPVFRGQIPFPGDLLANENPYRHTSYLGFNPGSIPHKAQGADIIKEIYPWRFFAVESLKKGVLPLWNPYNFSGSPQFANFQTAVFYPLNFIYFLFPFNFSWTILIILQPILAGIFMFLFLTRSLKLSNFSSFIGAIAFALSSYMVVWIQYGNIGHTLLWLPLILFLIKRFNDRVTALNFLAIVSILTLSFLGGYIQGLFYVYVVSFLYFAYLSKLKNLKKLFLLLASFAFPISLGAFQLLPTLELFVQSTRGSYNLNQISQLLLPPPSLLTIFAADFFGNPASRNYYLQGTYIERVIYVGIPILFFAIYSLKSKFKDLKFFAFLSAASLAVATNIPFIKYLYLLPIPVISTTVPTRELSVFIFSTIILGSIGINFWEKNKIKIKIPYVFISIYLLLWISVFLAHNFNILNPENFRITTRNLVLPSILIAFTIISFYLRNKLGKVLLTFLVVVDLLYFFNKITPFSPTELVYPKTEIVSYLQKNAGINRYWGYGSAYIPANFQTVDKTYSPEGNDPLHIASYGKLLASSANGKIPEALPRPDANIAPGYGQDDLKNNFYRKRILDLLGVKYIVHKADFIDTATFPKEFYSLIWTDSTLQLYENKNSFPRFFMTNNYIVSSNKNEVLDNIYDKNIDLKKTILLEEKLEIKMDKSSINEVNLVSYEPNKVIFKTNSTGNSLLFLSDNYYPGWRTRIDGKDTKLLVADYTFRAVAVPKGKHTVMLNYLPKSFILGSRLSVLGFVLLFITLFIIRKYEKN